MVVSFSVEYKHSMRHLEGSLNVGVGGASSGGEVVVVVVVVVVVEDCVV